MTKLYRAMVFWILVIIPLAALLLALHYDYEKTFFFGLIIYAIVYRPILNIVRLLQLRKISRKDIWKFFIPFYDVIYTKSLWWG